MTASSNLGWSIVRWEDFAGMGVAVVGVWDCLENLPRVFGESSIDQLQELARQRLCCVGFNSHKFDRALLAANGVEIAAHQSYDILRELWIASGLDPDALRLQDARWL